MKPVTLKHSTGQAQNEYGKLENTTEDITIQMAISTLSGSKLITNSILTVESTHLGLTNNTSITAEDRVIDGNDTYTIDYIIPARYTQVFLRLVK